MFRKIIAAIRAEWNKELRDLREMNEAIAALDISKKLKAGESVILTEGTTWEPSLERLKVIKLGPGDILVLETQDKLSDIAYAQIVRILSKLDYKSIILESGITLRAVLRQEKEPQK